MLIKLTLAIRIMNLVSEQNYWAYPCNSWGILFFPLFYAVEA